MLGIAIRVGVGLLLIVHGFAHWYVTSGWQTGAPARSWLLGAGGSTQGLATALWVVSLLACIVAGVVLMAHPAWWRPLSVAAAAVSLLTLALFWQPNLILGAAVDAGILVALLWARWPAAELVGA
jgi:hypothetical protein